MKAGPTMPAAPRLSVLLCNYNHGRFLRQCLDGIAGQTFRDYEIVVTDDGSTDDSREILGEYAARDSRLRVNCFATNRGVMAATADAWGRAGGELMFGHASDDFVSEPTFFARAVAALERHPQAAGFFGLTRCISLEFGAELGFMGGAGEEGLIPGGRVLQEFLRGRLFIPGASSVWRRRLLVELGGYDPQLGAQIDYYANHMLAARHGVIFEQRVFACVRSPELGGSYSAQASVATVAERLARVEELMRRHVPAYPGWDADWQAWRRRQLQATAQRCSPLQRIVTRAKIAVRAVLPGRIFRLLNAGWRHTVGPALRGLTRFNASYRDAIDRSGNSSS